MTQYTVSVMPGRGSFFSFLAAADPPVVPMATVEPFALVPPLPGLDTRLNAEAYGGALNAALSANAAIEAALQQIFDTELRLDTSTTLFFDLRRSDADAFRWEAIHAPACGFAAIARNCRVARIKRVEMPLVELPTTLRVMAILSAAGVPGKNEFDALVAAIETGRQAGIAIAATFLVGEQALLDKPRPVWLTVERIPAESAEFEARVRGDAPHILHVFCHGRVGGGGPDALEFATVNDWLIEAPMGSALLGIDRLGAALVNGATWLVVLNCCEGGTARAGAQSTASLLVGWKACAAAVGMVDPIGSAEATLVTAAFHSELFGTTLKVLADPPAKGSIDFTPAIAAAHRRFHTYCVDRSAMLPSSYGRWAMPVLYLAAETLPFFSPRPRRRRTLSKVRRSAPPAAEMEQARRDRLAIYARTLQSLPADTPLDVREKILALCDIEPAIPVDLRPDLFGNFAAATQAAPA